MTTAAISLPALAESARGRLDAACVLVHGSRRPGARAGAPVRPRVDVRRARGMGQRAGVVLLGTHRPRPRRCRTGHGRDTPRARQRLPPSRPPRRRRDRLPRDAAVPVPRVDVRARRDAAEGATGRARARVQSGRAVARTGLRGHVGPVRLREPGPRRGAARGCARAAPRDRRGERPRPRRDPLPLAPRVADRGQLEGRHGELPRVLPLPDRASGVQQGHRRQPRRLRPPGTCDLLEPDRPRPAVGARRERQGARTRRWATSCRPSTTSSSRRRR